MYVKKYLSNSMCHIIVAEEHGKVIGLLSYTIKPNLFHAANSCLIEEFIVGKKYRGKGVGKELMTKLFNSIKDEECAEISVSTEKNNEKAIKFYKNFGLDEEFIFLERHF